MEPETTGSMTENQFEANRRLMFSIAYRMMGSAMEAEDIVQDAYLRYQAIESQDIRSAKALLSTIIVRLCINRLNLAQSQRELYVGSWLPEPILTNDDQAALLPEGHLQTYESISMAFLMLLEKLSPAERAIFLLHEVFDYSYGEIATILGKAEATCRQLSHRAKKHIMANRARFKSSPEAHKQILDSFVQAATAGDLEGLLQLLANDVVLWADGGGVVQGAAKKPVYGSEAVARFILYSMNFLPKQYAMTHANVNGKDAVIIRVQGRAFLVISIDTDSTNVRVIRIVANPEKLNHLQ